MSVDGSLKASRVLKGRITAINPVDNTLTKAGFPADAKVTGDNLRKLDEAIGGTDGMIEHLKARNNPHGVTAEQVGLGNVDNTADVNKPVSNAQREAIENLSKTTNEAIENLSKTTNEAIENLSKTTNEAIDGVSQSTDDIATMLLRNQFYCPLAVDDETVLADDSGDILLADWKYKEM